MWRVVDCIVYEHDVRLVAVAAAICVFGCFTTISLLGRAKRPGASGRTYRLWAAAAVGGGSIWATHFVAMLSFESIVPVTYDLVLTLLSIVVAVGTTFLGFRIAIAGRTILGGAIAGVAVAAMHFIGMSAVSGPIQVTWDADYVVAAIAVSIAFGAAAIHVAMAPVSSWGRRLGALGLYVSGIVGLHFTAMTAVNFAFDPEMSVAVQIVDPEVLAVLVIATTLLIIGVGLTGSVVDQHLVDRSVREAERLRGHVRQLNETKRQLEAATVTLKHALDQASASSQAKSQFLAAMSHELRTPLNAVIGFAQMISRQNFGPVGDERYIEFATTIESSGDHLLSVINDILDLSSVDANALSLDEEETDFDTIVHEAIQMVGGLSGKAGVALNIDLPGDLPKIVGDQRRLRQCVLNILSNAIKFTPSGGEIRVTAERNEAGISVSVRDTGIGIAPEDIPRALERFGQVDTSRSRHFEGTGLGLPLSQDLVRLHDGTLKIESVVGEGTTVTINLPEERILSPDSGASSDTRKPEAVRKFVNDIRDDIRGADPEVDGMLPGDIGWAMKG